MTTRFIVASLLVAACTSPAPDEVDVDSDGEGLLRKKPSSTPPKPDAGVDAAPDAAPPPPPPPAWTDACSLPGAVVATFRPYSNLDPNDEGATSAMPLPFSFTYAGRSHTRYWLTSNGELGFGDTPGGSAFGSVRCPLPDTRVSQPIAFVYAVDLIGGTACVATTGSAPERKLHVTWRDKMFYELDGNGNGQSNVAFGAVLHEGTHRIELAVHKVEATSVFFSTFDIIKGTWSVVGVQSGTSATSFSCHESKAPPGTTFVY